MMSNEGSTCKNINFMTSEEWVLVLGLEVAIISSIVKMHHLLLYQ